MLKPIDIHNADFKHTFKGYNPEEVDAYIGKLVSAYETVYNENKKLQEQIQELEHSLRKHQNKEEDIYGLITLTKEATTEAKEIAIKQGEAVVAEATLKAKVIVDEAKLQAKQMIAETETYLDKIQRKLEVNKTHEQEFKKRMRLLMETFWAMLEDGDDSNKVAATSDFDSDLENGETKIYKDLVEPVVQEDEEPIT